MAGKFIVIEGGEGSGKDTQIALLKKHFGEKDFVFTREPGGTKMGENIRNVLLSTDAPAVDERAELLLFLAARAELAGKIITPALAAGKNVISNRFGLSTLAYQVYGRQHPEYLPLIEQFNQLVLADCRPDAYILLDLPPQVGLERVRTRPDKVTRFDEEAVAFHERVREGYLKHVEDTGKAIVVDASRPVEEVWHDVLAAVQSLI